MIDAACVIGGDIVFFYIAFVSCNCTSIRDERNDMCDLGNAYVFYGGLLADNSKNYLHIPDTGGDKIRL